MARPRPGFAQRPARAAVVDQLNPPATAARHCRCRNGGERAGQRCDGEGSRPSRRSCSHTRRRPRWARAKRVREGHRHRRRDFKGGQRERATPPIRAPSRRRPESPKLRRPGRPALSRSAGPWPLSDAQRFAATPPPRSSCHRRARRLSRQRRATLVQVGLAWCSRTAARGAGLQPFAAALNLRMPVIGPHLQWRARTHHGVDQDALGRARPQRSRRPRRC